MKKVLFLMILASASQIFAAGPDREGKKKARAVNEPRSGTIYVVE